MSVNVCVCRVQLIDFDIIQTFILYSNEWMRVMYFIGEIRFYLFRVLVRRLQQQRHHSNQSDE